MNEVNDRPVQAGNGMWNTMHIQSIGRTPWSGDYPTQFEQNNSNGPHGLKQCYGHHEFGLGPPCYISNPRTQSPEDGGYSVERTDWQKASDLPNETGGWWGSILETNVYEVWYRVNMTEDINEVNRPYEGVTVVIGGKLKKTIRTQTTTYRPPPMVETVDIEEEEENHQISHTFDYAESFGAALNGDEDVDILQYGPMAVQYDKQDSGQVSNTRQVTRTFESYSVTEGGSTFNRYRIVEEEDVTVECYLEYTNNQPTVISISPSNFLKAE